MKIKLFTRKLNLQPILTIAVLLFLMGVDNFVWGQTTQTFTSNGSFTVPAGVTSIKVEAWGGGAGGGYGGAAGNGMNGGGGGAYSSKVLLVTSGDNYSVVVGASGVGGTNSTGGTNGAASSFAAFVIALGGSASNTQGTVANGGQAASCTGDIKYSGGNGGLGGIAVGNGGGGGGSSATSANGAVNGSNFSGITGGIGGNGTDGDGGNGGNSSGSTAAVGTSPGGGGGGRGDGNGSSANGARGQVIVSWTTVTATTTETCLGGSTGTITATGIGGKAPFTYSLDAGAFQTGATFSNLAVGTYKVNVKDNLGCTAFTTVTVNEPGASADNQNAAGSNSWIGHVYDGTNFNTYYGSFAEAETFNQSFGGGTNCFNITSNSITRSIYTETFSVRYRMNSTKKGLYIADLGSDDGSRLTVDGTLLYNNWGDQGFSTRAGVLMNLNGASSLIYDFYENGGGNQVVFQNLALVLSNTLNTNTIQNICMGSTGSAISGDTYGALPAGITLSGTGYQWSYSTILTGVRTNIAGATGAAFIPSAAVAPFNVSGTYYVFRNAILSSSNNVSPNPYIATNESNAATITIAATPPVAIPVFILGATSSRFQGAGTLPYSATAANSTGITYSLDATSLAAGNTISSTTGNVTFVSTWTGNSTITATAAGCSGSTSSTHIVTTTLGATYYSYQTGSWNTSGTWTLDPSGTTQLGTTIPANNDIVVILTGRTVTLPANIATTGLNITIEEGGFLDLSTYKYTAGLAVLSGQGTLKIGASYFPTVTTNNFVNTGGGTTEYRTAINLPSQAIYNNLTINGSGITVTQIIDLTLNGNLQVKNGTFRINDNTARRLKLTVSGDVTVDAGANLSVGTGVTNSIINPLGITGGTAPFINYYDQQSHRIVLNGNFTNNGTVRFTNLAYPVFGAFPPTTPGATTGFATVYFQGASDNTLLCAGTTDFYNLILDKGIDQTFKLTIYTSGSSYSNFRLFGANVAGGDGGGANPNLKKALWIRTGTLVLEGLTMIPSLSEGNGSEGGANPNSDFYIPANGALVLNGADVVVLSTADDFREVNLAYGTSAIDNAAMGITAGGTGCALSLYGKLQINNGYLSTRESGGIITSSVAAGQFIMNNGTVDAKQFLGSTGAASYEQNGGLFILRGRFQRTPAAYSSVANLVDVSVPTLNTARLTSGINSAFGSFNLENTANIFTMSGGTMRIYDVSDASTQEAFDVKSASSNINVSGGTLEIRPTMGTNLVDAANYLMNTTAPLGNLTINRASSTSGVQLNANHLTLLKDFTLTSGVFNTNNYDITIGGNTTIEAGTTYSPGTNTTILNGATSQDFKINLATALALNNFTINKTAGIAVNLSGTQKTLNVTGNFSLALGTLNDNGNTINLYKDVYNSGIHAGTGKMSFIGAVAQAIDGNGIFNNIELNNNTAIAAPVYLIANATINGALTLSSNKLFNIGTYNLQLNASASIVNGGPLKYIQTSGNAGDGGLTKVYSTTTAFVFPIGGPSTAHPATPVYSPATIGFTSAPATYGSVTIIPVGYEHPATTVNGQSLTYFWRVKSSGFTGIPINSVTHTFVYDQSDVAGTETNYIPSVYNRTSFTWNSGMATNIATGTNIISDWATPANSKAFLDGDYTAGDAAFGTPKVYYSLNSGLWSALSTWTFNSSHAGAQAGSVPGVYDAVIIGGQDSVYLATDNTNANTDIRNCASLQIEKKSALDIGYNPACNFKMVLSSSIGNGNFRVTTNFNSGATFAFPSGDFSDFNVNLGTTELYTTNSTAGGTYWLPNNISTYGNLILSPLGGSNIIFPNTSLTIYGDLITRGQNADSWFCPTWNSAYPTTPVSIVAKIITINGDFNIQGGSLIWYGNGANAQNFVVNGNMTISALSSLYVYSGGANQSISIGGSLINNADGITHTGTTTNDKCDFTNIPVTFFGSSNASISNTTGNPTTIFSKVTINKGISQATTLTCNIGGTLTTPADNWLTLQNGTFKYMRNVNSDFTVSTITPFTIPATAAFHSEYTTANNILIANSASDFNDVYLNGKLKVVSGNVFIGPINGITLNNNDIEYSGGGTSEIEVTGGTLVVNGQIRQNPSSTAGVLKYKQSGGAVTINGNNTNTTNAKLELMNSGSEFTMSAGTLNIVRGGGGNAYGDLYLRPGTGSVTGGDINFTNILNGSNQQYLVDATFPLNNLTITGRTAATAAMATVKLMINPLVLNGKLTLTNAQSILDVNSVYNLPVTINGDFTNYGTYNHYNNLTTFSGGTQSLLGTMPSTPTDFYDLNVSPVTKLTLSKDITVTHDLSMGNGTLECTTFTVNAKGDVANNATYTNSNTNSGLILNGSSIQHLSGTGTFGQLELNNAAGAIAGNNITLNKDLVLTAGILDINTFLLTLGQNSNIQGAPFSATKMITSDGVWSNIGIEKVFGSPLTTTFTYPLGTPGKYTPAVLTITNNGHVGSIRVNNINSKHPSVLDPANVLKYYWEVESTGISGFSGNLLLYYKPSDVVGGPENTYIAAQLLTPGTNWSKAATGPATDNVNETNHTITFNYNNSSNLTGEYTAGNDAAIPTIVPQYTSNKDGNWTDNTIWTPSGGTTYPCPVGGPNGFIVTINHVVTANANYCFAYKTTINNKLRAVSPYYGHNFGSVYGNGTLYLESFVFPAGRYGAFIDCAGNSTIEYGGTGLYDINATLYSSVPRVLLSGTGTRVLPDKDLTFCKQLKIDDGNSGSLTLDNSINNRKLTINGTFERYNNGIFKSGTGSTAVVEFAGSLPQTIGGVSGDFTGNNAFNNFEINNSSGLSVYTNGNVEVNGDLLLTNGLISTTNTNKLIINNFSVSCVIPYGGSAASYIDGPLIKKLNQGDPSFKFPVGKKSYGLGNKLSLRATKSGTLFWVVEYFSPNPNSTYLSPLTAINTKEYWQVSGVPVASQAYIELAWDNTSDLTPLMTQNGISDMLVAEHNGTDWIKINSSATSGSDNYNGSAETSSRTTITSGSRYYTLSCENTPKPRIRLAPAGPVCGNAGIPVTLTSSFTTYAPYSISYTKNGVAQTPLTPASFPTTLPTDVAGGVYKITGFTYNYPASTIKNGVYDATPITVYAVPTTAIAGPDQSLCGATSATLAANAPTIGTGLWTIINGTGGTVVAPTSRTSIFNGTNGSTYTLRWTISNGTCTSSDDVIISFPLLAAQPSNISGLQTVCQGTTGVAYNVPNDPSVTYNWSYSGTGATINGIANAVTVNYNTSSTSGNLSVTATNSCNTSIARSLAIVVNPIPTVNAGGAVATICQGGTTPALGGSFGGGALAAVWSDGGAGGTFANNGGSTPGTTTYTASASLVSPVTLTLTTIGGSCGTTSASKQITVNPTVGTPVFTLGSTSTHCQGTGPVTYTATATNTTGITYTLDAVSISGSNTINAATGAVTYAATWSGTTTITASAAGCNGPKTKTHVVTITPTVGTPVFTIGSTSTRCQGAGPVTYAATATNNTGITYTLDAASITGGNSIVAGTGTVTYVAGWSGTTTITASAAGCNGPKATTHVVTITPTVTINAFSPATSTRCQGAGTVTTTTTATNTTGITYSLDVASITGGNSIVAGTGAVAYAAGWSGTTTITASAAGCNGPKTTTHVVTINPNLPVSVSIAASANPVCSGTSVTFTAYITNGGINPSYQWKVNGVNAGTNSTTYSYAPANNDAVTCILTSNAICASGNPATSNSVTMTVYALIGNNTVDNINGAHGVLCATAAENANAVLTAPAGTVFINVGFVSYGTPNGTCPSFTTGTCHALTSQSVSEGYLLGKNSGSIPATNGIFGDPCSGTLKRLYVLATYTEPICAGNTPGIITGTLPSGGNGVFTYLWESSITSSTSGFAAAAGTNNLQNYTPGTLTKTTWYRRKVTSAGCSDISTVILIKVNPVIAGNTIGTDQTICSGSVPAVLTGSTPSGGDDTYAYLWESSITNASTGFVDANGTYNGQNYVPGAITQKTWFRRTVISGGCINTSATIQITVNPLLPASIAVVASANNICSGTSVTFTATPVNGGTTPAYEWYNDASLISGETNATYTSTTLTNGNPITVKMTSTATCSTGSPATSNAVVMIVNPIPTATFSGSTVVCQNAPSPLITFNNPQNIPIVITINIVSVGDYNINVGANSSSTLSVPTNIAGTYIGNNIRVAYQTAPSCINTIPGSISVTITPLPVATFSYTGSPYCSNAVNPSPAFSGGGVAGTFSSTAGLVFVSTATGQVDLSASTAGTYTVTNTIATSGGCGVVTSTSSITITTLPAATIFYTANPICKSSSPVSVTRTGTAGGTYTSSPAGLTLDGVTGALTPSSSTAGTYTVTYTIAAAGGCGIITATTSVTITSVPTATISYAGTPFCTSVVTVQPVTLSGTVAYTGGTYGSTAGLALDAVTGAITPSTSAEGTYTVTYTIPASGGCAAVPVTTTVIITTLPVATFSYTGSPYCSNGSNPFPTYSGGGVAGTFSSTAGLVFVNTATGQVNLAASTAGNYTVTNTIAASGGCAQVTATSSITITTLPAATISYAGSPFDISMVSSQSVTFTGTTGGIYTASPAGLSIDAVTGAIAPVTSTIGTYTVTYTIATSGGCAEVTATTSVTVSGIINVTGSTGADGTYASLTNASGAFAKINSIAQTGNNVVITILGNSTSEAGTNSLNAGAWTSMTIYPKITGLTISGSVAGPLINLNGADNVTIDGRVNETGSAKDLTISNASTNAAASAIRFINDASANNVQYCTIQGSSTAVAIGTIFFSGGTTAGNDGNMIANNTITSAGSNLPVNAIYSAGTVGKENSGNTISNNDIQDFYSASLPSNGIYVASNSSAWTISGNKFFQTTNRTSTAANSHRGINIVSASGTGYIINNNIIGYANSAGTGLTTYDGAFANLYRGIEMTVGTAVASSVQGNTISAINFSTSSASALPGIFSGISVLAGKVDIGTVTGNTIGATSGNGSITITSTTTGGVITGIYSTSASAVNIQNNTIGSISTAGGDAIGYTFHGIYIAGTLGNYSIALNTIGSSDLLTSNSISIGNATTTVVCTVNGINNAATGTISITGNTVQNVSTFGTGASVLNGILNSAGSGTLTITGNNVIAINNTGTGTIRGISVTAATAATANINSNIIRSSKLTGTGAFTGILNASTVATTNLNSNVIRNINRTTATGAITGISSTGAITAALNINGNQLGNTDGGFVTYDAANSSALIGITVSGATAASALSIQNNDIKGIVHSVAGTNAHTYIINAAATKSQNISNNTFTNLDVNTTGSVTFISNSMAMPANGLQTVSGNKIVTGFNKSGVGGTVIGITSTAATANTGVTVLFENNDFSNITVTGNTPINGIVNTDTGAGNPTKTIKNNTLAFWTGGTGLLQGMSLSGTGTSGAVTGNTIRNFSNGNSITGITTGAGNDNIYSNQIYSLDASTVVGSTVTGVSVIAVAGNTKNIYQNTVYSLSTGTGVTTGTVNGISIPGSGSINAFRNKIYDLSSSSSSLTTGTINGIVVSGATASLNATITNNIIGDLRVTAGSGADLIRGISIANNGTTSNANVYYNTVYLNASSTGANFGTSGIYHAANTTATTAALDLRNNIIVNTSTPNGSGKAVAFRRSAGTINTLNNYASASNNNLFFAGAPGPSNLIYFDGTASGTFQTIDLYKTASYTAGTIAPRDQASATEDMITDLKFLSLNGADGNYLHINLTKPTLAESGAANIGGVTDDFDGETRQGNSGYTGNGTSPDIGADEFEGLCKLALTSATISYADAPFCSSISTAQSVTLSGSGEYTGGVFSSAPGLSLHAGTGAIMPNLSTAGTYVVTYTISAANGCGTVTATTSVTITTLPAATINYGGTPFCNSLMSAQSVTLSGTEAYSGGAYAALPAGLTINAGTGAIIPGTSTAGTYTVTYTIPESGGCASTPVTTSVIITALPVATFNYTGTPYCSNSVNPSPTYSGGGVAGTFSSTAGLVFISTATGQVDLLSSTAGTYTITNTVVAAGGCGTVSATSPITITTSGFWLGGTAGAVSDWNTASNWSCGFIPDLTTDVQIPNVTNKPILSSGAVGTVKNIIIAAGSSVTVTSNTLQIAGTITNTGTFTATDGSIEMRGIIAQTIGSGVFAGNTIKSLTINNPAGVTLGGPLNVTAVVNALNGNFSSDGHLTLISTATQTALIDGMGNGQVLGNVTMQRYLSSGFGYKYLSSPFQAATVNELADDIDLGASFPTLYQYDEENHRDSLGFSIYTTGWSKYNIASNVLNPMKGYAANFGALSSPLTVEMKGVVNNGDIQLGLLNNNHRYTKGFNLVGNPYPSPIDWDNAGWNKTEIDNAIYFFNAGTTDQYTGVYSSYINGVSSGNADNIIAAMQGFFVHVTDGAYPVSGTLGITNSVRTKNLNPLFKKSQFDYRTILRFSAHFDTKNAIDDAAVIYFEDYAGRNFDIDFDALKMKNTDVLVPNIYTISDDLNQLSINGLQLPTDSISKIPLGITSATDGWITFKAKDISQLPSYMRLYLVDAQAKVTQNLKQIPEYRFYQKTGADNQRFTLIFSLSDIVNQATLTEKMFTIIRSGDIIKINVNLPQNRKGDLMVTNMLGQILMRKDVFEKETVELSRSEGTGIYIISLVAGNNKQSEKILMRKDYE